MQGAPKQDIRQLQLERQNINCEMQGVVWHLLHFLRNAIKTEQLKTLIKIL